MPNREYVAALNALYQLEASRGMDLKLERVALILKHLGDPHRQFAAVHIAGTNGKGSVAAMLHAMFSAAGYRVGLYTSPHLMHFTERIGIGACAIAEDDVVRLAREIHAAAVRYGLDLTFFEVVTVMAFMYFAEQHVDLAIIEVGLGGRLDATNVLDPAVSVITSIGLDHEEFLGDTLQAVASEKAGIIKPARPVVIGPVSGEVATLLTGVAALRDAPVDLFGRDFSVTAGIPFRFSGCGTVLDGLNLALSGAHQCENAATALAAAVRLRPHWPIDDSAMRSGLANVRWPGRLDVVRTHPRVVLDGAHNPDGIVALVRELSLLRRGGRLHALFAVMRDKRWESMVDLLGPALTTVVTTSVSPPRGADPEILAQAFRRYCPARSIADPLQGLETLLAAVDAGDTIVVAGSLYLIGTVYPYFFGGHETARCFPLDPAALHP